MSPAPAGRFFTTELPGEAPEQLPTEVVSYQHIDLILPLPRSILATV